MQFEEYISRVLATAALQKSVGQPTEFLMRVVSTGHGLIVDLHEEGDLTTSTRWLLVGNEVREWVKG